MSGAPDKLPRGRAFGITGVESTPTGLKFTATLPFETWQEIGFLLGTARDWTAFALGDWLCFGESVYGELAAQGVEATGRTKATLLEYVRVARQVPPSRRRSTLSWSHHQAVAALEPRDQDNLLVRAETDRLSLEEFRALVRDDARPRRLGDFRSRPSNEVVELVWTVAESLLHAARPLTPAEAVVPSATLDRLANALGLDWVLEREPRQSTSRRFSEGGGT